MMKLRFVVVLLAMTRSASQVDDSRGCGEARGTATPTSPQKTRRPYSSYQQPPKEECARCAASPPPRARAPAQVLEVPPQSPQTTRYHHPARRRREDEPDCYHHHHHHQVFGDVAPSSITKTSTSQTALDSKKEEWRGSPRGGPCGGTHLHPTQVPRDRIIDYDSSATAIFKDHR